MHGIDWATSTYSYVHKSILADTPLEYPRSFVLGGKKKSSRWEGEGDKGGKGKKRKKTGEKTEGEKRKKWKGKKKKKKTGRIEPPGRIDLAQESNALPVTYCDSPAPL